MLKLKISGVSFSLNRAIDITQAKQKFARKIGIPTSKGWDGKKNREDGAECYPW